MVGLKRGELRKLGKGGDQGWRDNSRIKRVGKGGVKREG